MRILWKQRGLIDRILSVSVNIQKQARYICAIMQWSLYVTSSITVKSQADSSTSSCELFQNNTTEIYKNRELRKIY